MSTRSSSPNETTIGRRAMGWTVDVSTRHPWKTLGVFVVVTLLFMVPATQLRMDTSIDSLIETDDRTVNDYLELEGEFGEQALVTVVVDVGKANANVAEAYIGDLVEAIKGLGWFKNIRYSQDLSFAGENVLLYLPEETLYFLLDPNVTPEMAEAYLDSVIAGANQPSYIISGNGQIYLVNMVLDRKLEGLEDRDEVFGGLSDAIDDTRDLDPSYLGLDVGMTGGLVVLDYEGDKLAMDDVMATFFLSFVLILVLLFVAFRSLSLPMLTIVPLIMGIVITAGIVQLVFGALGIIAAAFAILLLGLGIDFSIHLLTRFQDEIEGHEDYNLAFKRTVLGTGKGVILGCLTTVTVFLALYFGETRALSEMGVISALGLLVTLTAVFFVLPALAVLRLRRGRLKAKMDQGRARFSILGALGEVSIRHAAVLVVVAIVVGGLFVYKAPEAELSSNMKDLYPTTLPSYQLLGKVQRNFNYTEDYFVAVGESFEDMVTLVERMKTVDEVYRVESILDYLPEDQELKLELIQQIMQTNPGLANMSLLQLDEVALTDLPEDIHKGFVSNSSGHERYLVRVVMKGDINDEAYRERVLPLLWEVNEGVTGQAIMFPVIIDSITDDVGRVSIYAIVPIMLIVYIGFGRSNPKYALLAMLPVVFGILGILSLYEYLDVTLNVISILTVPLVIGIAIDNGIHLVHRFMEEGEGSIPHVVQHTGRAVFLTSATTILAFSSFMIAEHPGIMSLGRVPVLGLSIGLLASLVFLPAAMRASLDRGRPTGRDKDPGMAEERTV